MSDDREEQARKHLRTWSHLSDTGAYVESVFMRVCAERDAAIAALSEKKLELGRARDAHDADGRALMRAHKERDAAIVRAERAEAGEAVARGEHTDTSNVLRGLLNVLLHTGIELNLSLDEMMAEPRTIPAALTEAVASMAARAEAAEARAASRLDVSPEDVGTFLMYHDVPDGHEHINGAGKRVHAPDRVYAALRAHAAKVSR